MLYHHLQKDRRIKVKIQKLKIICRNCYWLLKDLDVDFMDDEVQADRD